MLNKIEKFISEVAGLDWQAKLRYIAQEENVVFSTSFSLEDQLITAFIVKEKLAIEIFTIDTGRLFPETYQVWHDTEKLYNIRIKTYYPNQNAIGDYVSEKGINAFYEAKPLRLECCHIRKVEPLQRSLIGKNIWLSGIRKGHSNARTDKPFFEYDSALEIMKFYPVLDLEEEQVWQELKDKKIPYNILYTKGYKSIGCAPCTRATGKDEDPRAGRWWWEEDQNKECGLHLVNGKLVRQK
jgi:phosphoadenosine phosphosulfate reductase